VFTGGAEAVGLVRILGIKKRVLTAALPNADSTRALERLQQVYPCFLPAESVLTTSLENIWAILHCAITLFNAAAIERGDHFKFYHNIIPQVARFIVGLDQERLRLTEA
jgi:opine dehydrogenase